jgi:hypothetical protein
MEREANIVYKFNQQSFVADSIGMHLSNGDGVYFRLTYKGNHNTIVFQTDRDVK